jgi:hypothetical protein
MVENIWVHIRRHDLSEALYVNGELIMEDDVLLATDVLDKLLPLITPKEKPILFTVDAINETDDSEEDWELLFPSTLDFSDIGKYEEGM